MKLKLIFNFYFIQVKLCDEFGEEDSSTASNKWKYFFLTGLGIGLVATYKLTHWSSQNKKNSHTNKHQNYFSLNSFSVEYRVSKFPSHTLLCKQNGLNSNALEKKLMLLRFP